MLSNSSDTVLKCLRLYKYEKYTLKILLECGLRLGQTSIKGNPKRASRGQSDPLSYALSKFHLVHKDSLFCMGLWCRLVICQVFSYKERKI